MYSSKYFHNKVVWVTGASSGIGEALVQELASSRAKIILSSRRKNELERVQENYCQNIESMVLPLDLEDSQSMEKAVDQVIQRFGRLDILIHNGGVSQRSLSRDTNWKVFDKIMNINYLGTVALTLATLPIFRKQKSGVYVVVTSIVGKIGTPLRSGYSASKHALHGFFDSLRAEEYDTGIKVLMVLPGYIKTQVSVNALVGDGKAQGTMDEAQAKGISPHICAQKILAGIQNQKDEIVVAKPREKLALYLKRFFPGILARMLRKAKVT